MGSFGQHENWIYRGIIIFETYLLVTNDFVRAVSALCMIGIYYFFGVIPDIDSPTSKPRAVADKVFFLRRLWRLFRHRGFFHSPLFALSAFGGTFAVAEFLIGSEHSLWYGVFAVAGVGTHLLCDWWYSTTRWIQKLSKKIWLRVYTRHDVKKEDEKSDGES